MMYHQPHTKARGFTMFFAVLVSSLALAIGLAIYDLVTRELLLSTTTAQSQYAIYAADTGVECALYWDFKYNTSNSIFPTSTSDVGAQNATNAYCNGNDVTVGRTMALTSTAATTSIVIQLSPFYVTVQVSKFVSGGALHTSIYSHGFNTQATTSASAVERELKVSY